MAEEKREEKREEKKKSDSTETDAGFGIKFLIFIVIIFILWVISGGAKKEQEGSLFLEKSSTQTSTVKTN